MHGVIDACKQPTVVFRAGRPLGQHGQQTVARGHRCGSRRADCGTGAGTKGRMRFVFFGDRVVRTDHPIRSRIASQVRVGVAIHIRVVFTQGPRIGRGSGARVQPKTTDATHRATQGCTDGERSCGRVGVGVRVEGLGRQNHTRLFATGCCCCIITHRTQRRCLTGDGK